jgi:hypothetical protein
MEVYAAQDLVGAIHSRITKPCMCGIAMIGDRTRKRPPPVTGYKVDRGAPAPIATLHDGAGNKRCRIGRGVLTWLNNARYEAKVPMWHICTGMPRYCRLQKGMICVQSPVNGCDNYLTYAAKSRHTRTSSRGLA